MYSRIVTILVALSLVSVSRAEDKGMGLAENKGMESWVAPKVARDAVRFATFNASLFRSTTGQLTQELKSGSDHARAIARILQAVNADVILLNEFDYDGGLSAQLFLDQYLNVAHDSVVSVVPWPYHYSSTVNTGVDSGLDLDRNGQLGTPNDAWGFGTHPGQYGLLVISRFPIDSENIRTFQKFRWSQMPEALQPMNADGTTYYAPEVWKQLRLSSKSHFDVPIRVHGSSVHFLVLHPTPPVFDGPEDRNGKRNHDEIRLIRDYACEEFDGSYIVDDQGRQGGLLPGSLFVIAGDLNADPYDGDGIHSGIQSLLKSPSVNQTYTPSSTGGIQAAQQQANKNLEQRGEAKYDTGDFNDRSVGNLRIDYVIASRALQVTASGILWPRHDEVAAEATQWLEFSDHRLVWADVMLPSGSEMPATPPIASVQSSNMSNVVLDPLETAGSDIIQRTQEASGWMTGDGSLFRTPNRQRQSLFDSANFLRRRSCFSSSRGIRFGWR